MVKASQRGWPAGASSLSALTLLLAARRARLMPHRRPRPLRASAAAAPAPAPSAPPTPRQRRARPRLRPIRRPPELHLLAEVPIQARTRCVCARWKRTSTS